MLAFLRTGWRMYKMDAVHEQVLTCEWPAHQQFALLWTLSRVHSVAHSLASGISWFFLVCLLDNQCYLIITSDVFVLISRFYSDPHLDSASLHLDVATRQIASSPKRFVHASMTHRFVFESARLWIDTNYCLYAVFKVHIDWWLSVIRTQKIDQSSFCILITGKNQYL